LKHGKAEDTVIVGKRGHLSTFFPQARNVNIGTVSTVVAHAYQNMQANNKQAVTTVIPAGSSAALTVQGGDANEQLNYQNWWALMTAFMYPFQRRFNEQMVIPFNCPTTDFDGTLCFIPSQMYVDSTAFDVHLPVILTEAIDALGAVVDGKGVLQVPVAVYAQQTTQTYVPFPVTAATAIGPIAWSAFGFTTAPWSIYPYANIHILGVATTGGTSIPLNIQLDTLVLDNALAVATLGWNQAGTVLFPWYLSGPWFRQIVQLFDTFARTCSQTNSFPKQYVKPSNPPLGFAQVMLTEISLNLNASQIENLIPNNLKMPPTFNVANTLKVFRSPIISVSTTFYLDRARGYLAMVYGYVGSTDQASVRSGSQLFLPRLLGQAILAGTPMPSLLNAPGSVGLLQVVPPSGNALNNATARVLEATSGIDCPFFESVRNINAVAPGRIVSTSLWKKMQLLNYTRPFLNIVNRIAQDVFHKGFPNVTPTTVGKLGKGATKTSAVNLAILDSGSGITAQQHETSEAPPHKAAQRKFDGHRLKKFAGAIKKISGKVSSGVNKALTVVEKAGDVLNTGATILGAL